MKRITKLAPKFAYIVTLFTIMGAMGFTGLYLAVGSDLPEVETIRKIRLQTPMSVYSKDGQLINEFGDIRRIPITLDEVPEDFINALLSTEDVRFFEHSGVDFRGVMRATLKLAMTGTKSEGASTITMLVARNYYLSRERRFSRKFTEMFVAWKLEAALSKEEILEIFLNKIPFGHRSAGLGAAAEVYYGKPLDELSLAQLATLAGIPKGQSVFNPISNPKKAKERRAHVLGRMLTEGHINNTQFDEANNAPIKSYRHGAKTTVSAPYIAEMVHTDLINRFGRESAHNDGLKVFTSIDPTLQNYAQKALRSSLIEYDRRHGFRTVEQHYEINEFVTKDDMLAWIGDFPTIGSLIPALVTSVNKENAEILLADGSNGQILLKDSLWARKYIDENHREYKKLTDIDQIVIAGDVIRVIAPNPTKINEPHEPIANDVKNANNSADAEDKNTDSDTQNTLPTYQLSQIPDVNGGFVVLNPKNGAVQALAGGFNFSKNQFNMVTQAKRQIGSNIKPFIYSAALEKNFTAASLVNDSPYIENDVSAGNFWRPENDSGNYRGPTRLRVALRWSVNTVAIRLIKKFGPKYAKSYLEKIGFPGSRMQPYPSLALGSASFTPLEVATGYATLANGGYQVFPWYIQRIEDSHGQILFEQQPVEVCEECLQILEAQKLANAIMDPQNPSKSDDESIDRTKKLQPASENTFNKVDDTIEHSLLPLIANQEKPIQNLPVLPIAEEKIAHRVIEARNRYIIDDILKDVIHRGTAWGTLNRAKSPLLRRNDLSGKTGTTNDVKDAWFSGYNNQYVASAWVGFVDHSKKLGKSEFGGRAALPIWQKFMEKALKGTPQISLPRPEGIVDVKIDLTNGLLASANTNKSDFEVFRVENTPTEYSEIQSNDHIDELDQNEQEEFNNNDESDLIDF